MNSALPKHCGHVLPRRAERTLIAIQHRQDHGTACFQGDAGRIRELLQRDDVRVELADDRRDAIGIVASVGADARVHVVGGDAKCADSAALAELRAVAMAGDRWRELANQQERSEPGGNRDEQHGRADGRSAAFDSRGIEQRCDEAGRPDR